MNKIKLAYRIVTGLMTALFLMGVGMYIFNHEMAVENFTSIKFPTWLIYPLATAKTLGLIAIWTDKVKWLTQWAYAGFFFNLLLAFGAHISVNDGNFGGAVMGLVVVSTSFFLYNKLAKQ